MKCYDGLTFTFDGISSEAYGLLMGWKEAQEEWATGLEREVLRGEMNMSRRIPNYYGARYSDVLALDFYLFHMDGSPFDYKESRAVNNWLVKDSYRPFKVHDDNVDNVYYMAMCTSIQDVSIGGFAGKSVRMSCDSPFGYAQEKVKSVDARNTGNELWRCNCTSDDGDYYPRMDVLCGPGYSGSVEISNETEGRTMGLDMSGIAGSGSAKKLIVDSGRMMLLGEDGLPMPLYKVGWSVAPDPAKAIQSSEIYWFRMLPGFNKIRVKGNARVTFRMRFPRKVGQMGEERNLSM